MTYETKLACCHQLLAEKLKPLKEEMKAKGAITPVGFLGHYYPSDDKVSLLQLPHIYQAFESPGAKDALPAYIKNMHRITQSTSKITNFPVELICVIVISDAFYLCRPAPANLQVADAPIPSDERDSKEAIMVMFYTKTEKKAIYHPYSRMGNTVYFEKDTIDMDMSRAGGRFADLFPEN